MPDLELQLRQEDARLVFLAVAYHLGRPGSELDPITKQPVSRGLAETSRALQPQLQMAVSTIELNQDQWRRLGSAILGSISELKTYPMLQPRPDSEGGGRRSSVPGFDRTLRHFFPEVEEDPYNAIELAERLLLFKRRLDEKTAGFAWEEAVSSPPAKKKGFWPFNRG
jgi:hypothetical protein